MYEGPTREVEGKRRANIWCDAVTGRHAAGWDRARTARVILLLLTSCPRDKER
jgi:hypothetical protein